MAYLILKADTGEEQIFRMETAVTTLGRNSENSVMVRDMTVSRFHARIVRRESWFFLEDLGSTHGTFINHARISGESLLRDNDRVRVGNTELLFRSEETPDAEAAPAAPPTLRYTSAADGDFPPSSLMPTDQSLPPVETHPPRTAPVEDRAKQKDAPPQT